MAGTFRAKWGAKIEFILTCISYSVGLGNVWRFPYMVFKNGGGAFLIPYWLVQIFVGMPLYFMELSFGQFAGVGPITLWKANPLFKGIGISMVVVVVYICLYYNVLVGYIIFYFFSSMQSPLPWTHCNHYWSSPNCVGEKSGEDKVNSSSWNLTNGFGNSTLIKNLSLSGGTVSPTQDYFERFVLEMTDGIHNMGGLNWKVSLCVLLAWIVVFLVLIKGIRSLGKVVYFTATFPYAILISLFIRSALLPGATEGILYFLTPRWDRLKDAQVWSDATTQVFYSLGISMGGLTIMASFNKFKNNSLKDSILVPCVDCFTSFLSGLLVFSVLGFMAHTKGVSIEEVAVGGPGLAFIAYPEAVGNMPAPTVWAVLFFLMMLIIGFSPQFGMVETVISSLCDEFASVLRKSYKRTLLFRFVVCLAFCALALPMTTGAGIYILNMFDCSVGGFPLLIIASIEVCVIMFVYGYRRFSEDLAMMLGKKPSPYFKLCWCFITPVMLTAVLVFKAIKYRPLSLVDYVYPPWAQFVGWVLVIACVIFIPGWLLYYYCKHGGCKLMSSISKPDEDWGPCLPENRTGRYALSEANGTGGQSEGQIPSIVVSGAEEFEQGIDNMAYDQDNVDLRTQKQGAEMLDDWEKDGKGDDIQDFPVSDEMPDGSGWNTCMKDGYVYDDIGVKGMDDYIVKNRTGDIMGGSCKGRADGSVRSRNDGSFKGRASGSFRNQIDGSFNDTADGGLKGYGDGNFTGRADGSVRSRADGSVGSRANGSVRSRTDDSTRSRIAGSFKDRADGSIRSSSEGSFKDRADGSIRSRTEGSFKGQPNGSIRRAEDCFKGRAGDSIRSRGDGSIRSRTDVTVKSSADGTFMGRPDGSIRSRTDGSFKGGMDGNVKIRRDGSIKSKSSGSVRSRNGISLIEVFNIQDKSEDTSTLETPAGGNIGEVKTSNCVYSLDDISDARGGKPANSKTVGGIQNGSIKTMQGGGVMETTKNRSGSNMVYGLEEANVNVKHGGLKEASNPQVSGAQDLPAGTPEGYVYDLDDPTSKITPIKRYSVDRAAKIKGIRVFPLEDPNTPDGKGSIRSMKRTWEDKSGTTPTGSVRSMRDDMSGTTPTGSVRSMWDNRSGTTPTGSVRSMRDEKPGTTPTGSVRSMWGNRSGTTPTGSVRSMRDDMSGTTPTGSVRSMWDNRSGTTPTGSVRSMRDNRSGSTPNGSVRGMWDNRSGSTPTGSVRSMRDDMSGTTPTGSVRSMWDNRSGTTPTGSVRSVRSLRREPAVEEECVSSLAI